MNGLLCCHVNSWLTGKRLVSLPFSDYCDPLIHDDSAVLRLIEAARRLVLPEKLRYVEIRARNRFEHTLPTPDETRDYYLHELDLRPDLGTLYRNCHKDSTQRKIRRAEREGLIYEEGRSESLIMAFYRLFVITRRRHYAPPPPLEWFRNLTNGMGDVLKIRVARKNGRVVAAIITLRHKDTLVYKYGCSDARFHNLGAMQFLFWRAIEEAKRDGMKVFDFGRSNPDDNGLLVFKDRWGAHRSLIRYLRYGSPHTLRYSAASNWMARAAKVAFEFLPKSVFEATGRVLYRHIG